MSTKSDLKENILASKIESLVRWMFGNRGPVLTGVGVLVVAILFGSVVVIRRRENNDLATTQIGMAQSYMAQKKFVEAGQILEQSKSKVSSREMLAKIAYLQGLASLSNRNFDQAELYFKEVLDGRGAEILKPLALSNLAFTFEEKKDFNSAAQMYGQFMSKYSSHFLAPRMQLSLGRALLLSGQNEEAKKALTQLIELYPTSSWAENARRMLDKK